ncbi:MAG TPA: hypothetical protein DEA40_13645 [Parvularcula sp.]|nr:hypothetical protein [Parvularcula sp.]HBS36214.1 hypothetical protein [Parvularcula sp.]
MNARGGRNRRMRTKIKTETFFAAKLSGGFLRPDGAKTAGGRRRTARRAPSASTTLTATIPVLRSSAR